jgi:c-opsin
VNWESRTDNSTSYIVFLFIFGLVVPVFVICYSYFNIMHTMKKVSCSMRNLRLNALLLCAAMAIDFEAEVSNAIKILLFSLIYFVKKSWDE